MLINSKTAWKIMSATIQQFGIHWFTFDANKSIRTTNMSFITWQFGRATAGKWPQGCWQIEDDCINSASIWPRSWVSILIPRLLVACFITVGILLMALSRTLRRTCWWTAIISAMVTFSGPPEMCINQKDSMSHHQWQGVQQWMVRPAYHLETIMLMIFFYLCYRNRTSKAPNRAVLWTKKTESSHRNEQADGMLLKVKAKFIISSVSRALL